MRTVRQIKIFMKKHAHCTHLDGYQVPT